MGEPSYLPRYTIEDYLRWEGRWELWDGLAVAMSPSSNYAYQKMSGKAQTLLLSLLGVESCGDCEGLSELDWHVNTFQVVRPDVLVTCSHDGGDYLTIAPQLIIEVLSDSTRDKDLTAKRVLYKQKGVRYCFVIDPETRELFRWEEGDWKRVDAAVLPLRLHGECQIDLMLDRLLD